ncbi:ABC transporter ATP-binding protein [Dehalococcoidia bacterium]|nr:ABC transporter ATP-binding protein [Dehalococcoidia bacterium]
MQNDILLKVEDLHTWFELRKWGFLHAGFVRAVDGVSFELGRGEAVAIVGESGCGKSTLAKTILGLVLPTKGGISFNGRGLEAKKIREYRSQVGYIQQDPYEALASFLDVRGILEEPLRINGVRKGAERKERIEEVLTEVKLTPVGEFLPKFPHMLSGGQQQRVVIARAMILKPKLIVADEPVSMLDASVRVEILQLLEGLQHAHNLGVIYITHDLATVRYFTERIFVMYGANLVEQARVKELLDNPLHPYTRALLTATSDPDPENAATFKEVPSGEPPSLRSPPAGCRFHPRCSSIIKGLCDVERPPDFERGEGHSVMCWLYK